MLHTRYTLKLFEIGILNPTGHWVISSVVNSTTVPLIMFIFARFARIRIGLNNPRSIVCPYDFFSNIAYTSPFEVDNTSCSAVGMGSWTLFTCLNIIRLSEGKTNFRISNIRFGLLYAPSRINSISSNLYPSMVGKVCLRVGDLDLTRSGGSAGDDDLAEELGVVRLRVVSGELLWGREGGERSRRGTLGLGTPWKKRSDCELNAETRNEFYIFFCTQSCVGTLWFGNELVFEGPDSMNAYTFFLSDGVGT